jgi:hypothetical protein
MNDRSINRVEGTHSTVKSHNNNAIQGKLGPAIRKIGNSVYV